MDRKDKQKKIKKRIGSGRASQVLIFGYATA